MDLHAKIMGQGPALLVLHGLFGTSDNWVSLARDWAKHYTVILPDLRNHGRSPHHPEMGYEAMTDDLLRLLEREWVHRAFVIGHSMGGKVAMHLALGHPDLVERLLVADIAPKAYPGGHEEIFRALQGLPVAELTNRPEAEELLLASIPDEAVVQFLLKNLARAEEGGFRWKMNLEAIARHYPAILAAVPADASYDRPTLFLRGERSRYILDDDLPAIREQFPASRLETIPGAGHWLHADRPALFDVAVRDFLHQ